MKSQEADRQNQQPPTDWGGGERHDEALVPRLVAPTGTIWRRTVLFGVPGLYIALGLMHPTTNPGVGDESAVFIGLHIVQLFLVGGLAVMMWMLVGDLDNQAATITRVLILPFVIAYTALDAILGIAWGIVAAMANQLPAADQAAAGRLVDELQATEEAVLNSLYAAETMEGNGRRIEALPVDEVIRLYRQERGGGASQGE